MSYGTHNWTFEELMVYNDPADEKPCEVSVEFLLVCTSLGEPESGRFGPPEYYDPGEPATWEVETIEITFNKAKPLRVTEAQLSELFPNGDDMINNAIEDAAQKGVIDDFQD